MTSRLLTSLPLLLLLLATGCHKSAPPTRYICLLDISASIYPEAVKDEFTAMDELADRLHRGDQLVIIPIASDARNDVQGHIVRIQVPEERAAYDADLVEFRETAHVKIARLRDWAISHPSAHTDILGTLQVAQQEMSSAQTSSWKLIILSDFLEDDGTWNFITEPALDSPAHARSLANGMNSHWKFQPPSVYLGQVRGRDSIDLSKLRWDALDAFWGALLIQSEQQPLIHIDGIGSFAANP